jgi:hypothetical protein
MIGWIELCYLKENFAKITEFERRYYNQRSLCSWVGWVEPRNEATTQIDVKLNIFKELVSLTLFYQSLINIEG